MLSDLRFHNNSAGHISREISVLLLRPCPYGPDSASLSHRSSAQEMFRFSDGVSYAPTLHLPSGEAIQYRSFRGRIVMTSYTIRKVYVRIRTSPAPTPRRDDGFAQRGLTRGT